MSLKVPKRFGSVRETGHLVSPRLDNVSNNPSNCSTWLDQLNMHIFNSRKFVDYGTYS